GSVVRCGLRRHTRGSHCSRPERASLGSFFFSSRRRHTRSVSAFLLNRSSDLTRRRFLNEWEAFKKVISRRNIRRRITIPLTLSNLKLLRRITRTENILHRNFTRRQVAIQNRVASNIGISQSTFSVKVL